MSVVLTPEQEDAAERLVAAGLFASKEDAIARSHEWLLAEAAKLDALRLDIQEGIDQLDRGEGKALDADEIKRRIRERLSAAETPV